MIAGHIRDPVDPKSFESLRNGKEGAKGDGNGYCILLGLYACMLAPTSDQQKRRTGNGGKGSQWLDLTGTWTNLYA